MTDEKIYEEIKKYFCIQELVSPIVYKIYGERAWKFLCPRLLHTLLVIRIFLNRRITVNDWKWGGKFKQRGLRSNLGYIFLSMFKRRKLYLSAHILGRGLDFDVDGMSAEAVRMSLKGMHKELPYKIRLEHKMKGKPIPWVHLDMIWEEKNIKVYRFNV